MSNHLNNILETHKDQVETLEAQIREGIGHLSFHRVSYGTEPKSGRPIMSWKVTDPQLSFVNGCFLWWLDTGWVLSDTPTPPPRGANLMCEELER